MPMQKKLKYYLLGGVTVIAAVLALQKANQPDGKAAGTEVKREKIAVSDGRYVVVEVLRDDMAHFEMSSIDSHASATRPIITTPMVYKTDYAGPTTYSRNGNIIKTKDMQIVVDTSTLNITVYDETKSPHLKLGTYSYLSANQDKQQGIQISKEIFTDVYGLGQKFPAPGVMDGNWAGKDRMAGRPNGAPFGNVMEGFEGGMAGNTQFPIAYIVGPGKNSYAFFCDNQYGQDWSLSGTAWSIRAWGDWMRFYIITGPDLKDLRSDYMELTGKPPVPPKKAFGLWVSKYGYKSWNEIDGVLGTLKTNKFPIDGFILDLFWFTGRFNLGKLDFDAANFSNAGAKINGYKNNDGVGLVCIEESYINTDNQKTEWNDMTARGFVVKNSTGNSLVMNNNYWGNIGMIDWSQPAAGQYWHTLKRKPNIVDKGVIGHWTDLGEPEMFDATAQYHGLTYDYKPLTNHGDVHNLYCFLWNKSMWDGYYPAVGAGDTQRLWILARSGTSGSQRFGVGMWSSDVASKLSVLRTQMNAQMNISMSGIDYYGSDIGGFKRHVNDGGDLDKRFTQWFANGCMFDVPVRPHVDDGSPDYKTSPAEIGNIQANKENLRLRYELIPYYYSLAYRAYKYGEPVIPPLVYYYQDDGNVRQNANEKMIGPELLVAVEADYDITVKNVYLPAGNWYNYRTNAFYPGTGGRNIGNINLYDNGKFKLPLFAKAGALVPLMQVDDQTANALGKRRDNTNRDELIARVFADPTPSVFTLYEDEGTTTAYLTGAVRTTELSQTQSGNNVTVTIAASNGAYFGAPSSRNNVVQLVTNGLGKPESVTVNGSALTLQANQQLFDNAASGWYYAGNNFVWAKSGVLPVNTAKTVVFHGRAVPPDPPTNVKAVPGDAQVNISWDPVSSATSYCVYWTTGNTPPTKASYRIAGITEQGYRHKDLINGTRYNYMVTAVNDYGESDLSSSASAVPNRDTHQSHFGNNPALRLTGQEFANWDPANSQYVLSLAGDFMWEANVQITSAKTNTPYKITLNGTWNVNWGGNASGTDAYLARTGENARVTLAAGAYKLRITEGATLNDPLHVQWLAPVNSVVVHFKEWESAASYSIHCWDGLSGDYLMAYEGEYNGSHWWKVSLSNAPAAFKFCFKNSNNNWDGGNRMFTNQAGEIYTKAWDNAVYTSRP